MRYSLKIFGLIFVWLSLWISLSNRLVAETVSKNRLSQAELSTFVNGYYKVDHIAGDASYRIPFRVHWRRLRAGVVLPFGSTLQIQPDAAVDMSYRYRNMGAWKAAQTYVKVKQRVTLVLDEQFLRKVEMESYFVNVARAREEKKGPVSEDLDFQKAWNRLVTVIRDVKSALPSFKLKNNQASQIALRQKKITLLLPEDGSSFVVGKFPVNLQVQWINPTEDAQKFKVFLTPYTEKSTRPVAEVWGESYRLTVPEQGSYLVRVTSLDERFSSYTSLVHFMEEPPELLTDKVIDKSEHVIYFPPDHFSIQARENPTRISFYGRFDQRKKKSNMLLNILPLIENASIPLQPWTFPISINFGITIPLAPGSYQWWLEYDSLAAVSENDLGVASTIPDRLMSEKRSLTVLGADGFEKDLSFKLLSLLQDSLTSDTSRSIFLTEP